MDKNAIMWIISINKSMYVEKIYVVGIDKIRNGKIKLKKNW